jgi:hypothetical protein
VAQHYYRSQEKNTFAYLLPESLLNKAASLTVAQREIPYDLATNQQEINEKFTGKHRRGAAPTGMGYVVEGIMYFFIYKKEAFGVMEMAEPFDITIEALVESGAISKVINEPKDQQIYSLTRRNEFKQLFILPVYREGIILFAEGPDALLEMYAAGTGESMPFVSKSLEQLLAELDTSSLLAWMYCYDESRLAGAIEYAERNQLPNEVINNLEGKLSDTHLVAYIISWNLGNEVKRTTIEEYSDSEAALKSLQTNKANTRVRKIPGYPQSHNELLTYEKINEKWIQDGSMLRGELLYDDKAIGLIQNIAEYYRENNSEPGKN